MSMASSLCRATASAAASVAASPGSLPATRTAAAIAASSTSKHHRLLPFFNSARPIPQFKSHSTPSFLLCPALFSLNLRRQSPSGFTSAAADASVTPNAEEEEEELVKEAVAEILQESGVSEEEAKGIVAKSSKYVKMLRDGVRELDELSLWSSWSWMKEKELHGGPGGVEDTEELSLKTKVKLMAMEKGDNGKIPYLQSIGLSSASASHLARILPSETLPTLIRRVKYVKEIFFSGSDDQKFIGKRARQMMLHLSIPVDEDLQQTLSFFEKMEARRGGLDMLASEDASFGVLIESFPSFLSLCVEATMKSVADFLEEIGVPRQHLGNILMLYPAILLLDIEKDIKPGIEAFHKVDIFGQNIGRMVYKYPWILSSSIQENFVEVVSSLESNKVPKVSIFRAIKSLPLLLGCSKGKFRPMMMQMHKFGVKGGKLGKVIANSPQLLLRKPQEFLKVVAFVQNLGFDEISVGQILLRCPEIFCASIDNTLQRKVDFLTVIGISKHQLPRVVKKFPELLVLDVDTSVPARLNYLMSIGFSRKDIRTMVSRFSPLLGYSIEEVLKPKLEFMVNTMERPLSDVVDYPRYFSYSLEKRIKPRFFVLKSRNINCSLKDMLGKNDEEFATEYLGIERMFIPPC
ncbi:hypothetical protein Dimus_003569 [Dionaea muscipula]